MNDGNGWSEVGELSGADLEAGFLEAMGFTPLLVACGKGDLVAVVKLLCAGADINESSPSGVTPLSVAQQRRDSELAEVLLFAGADPSRMSHHDWPWLSPLITKVALHYLDSGRSEGRKRSHAPGSIEP